jgi:hypothetical protein
VQVFDARLEAVIKNLHVTYQCRMYNRKFLMIIQIYSVIKLYMFRASSLPIMKLTSAEYTVENS